MQRVLLPDFDVIDNWHSDLDDMNEGKEELLLTDIRIHSFVQLLGHMEFIFIYHTDKSKVLLSGLMLMTKYHLYQTTAQQ